MDFPDSQLFVYGLLLDPAERVRLLGHPVDTESARLEGYERGRRRYYFVTPREGTDVNGEVLSGLDERDFSILDEFEEVPRLYTRDRVDVVISKGRRVRCWIYLPTGWER
jgi:gamma-glutamylcyclotransferase (GGCT)/AIG2-like uncharacterized protein YtfP